MKVRSLWLWQLPVSFKIGAAILLFLIVLAAVGFVWTPYPPLALGTGIPAEGISFQHLFGVDQLGRDVFSRALRAIYVVLLLSLSGTLLGFVFGAALGLFSALRGGWADLILQRFFEMLISVPFLVLAMMAIVAAGPRLAGNPFLLIGVVAFVYLPRVARIARGAGLDVVARDYVMVARMRGESSWWILTREMLPNVSGPLLVEFAIRAGYAPILVGALGFLGFGIRPPTPEWGAMISENRDLLLASPATVLGPGLMLATLVIGLNMFTDGVARAIART